MTEADKLRSENNRLKKRIADLEMQIESLQIHYDQIEDEEWGDDFNGEEIQKLNTFYKNYTQGIPKITPMVKYRLMDVSRLELRKQQLGSLPDAREAKLLQEELSNVYKILGIQNLATIQDQTTEERFFESVIAKIEQTEPAESEDDYTDAAGYEQMQSEILRCLKNNLAGSRDFPELADI